MRKALGSNPSVSMLAHLLVVIDRVPLPNPGAQVKEMAGCTYERRYEIQKNKMLFNERMVAFAIVGGLAQGSWFVADADKESDLCAMLRDEGQTTPRGFEPLRAEPNGFRVHLLSRSDTVS